MENEALVSELQLSGRVSEEQVSRWREAVALMAALEAITRDGTTAVLISNQPQPHE
jgi:hypothetical protein